MVDKEVTTELFLELEKLLWAMTWDACNPERWMLCADEVFGELSAELVNVVDHYQGKPYNELKALAIVSCRNRTRDLISMCYDTHRKAETGMLDIDDDDFIEPPIQRQRFDIKEFLDNLTEDAQRLVLECLWPGDKTKFHLKLVEARKRFTAEKGLWQLKITPQLMMRALGWSRERLDQAWLEVMTELASF